MPERGWGPAPVRVCDNCYDNRGIQLGNFELIVTELSLGNSLKSLSLASGSPPFPLGVDSVAQTGFWHRDFREALELDVFWQEEDPCNELPDF